MIFKSKHSQAQIIVTVLLILIAIAAVTFVSTFVISLVRDQLSGTGCINTIGQLEVKVSDGITCYNPEPVSGDPKVFITIERGNKEFNLTGISVSVGNEAESKTVVLKAGESTNAWMYTSDGSGKPPVVLPNVNEKKSYVIPVPSSALSNVNQIVIAPVIEDDRLCDVTDEKEVPECD